jgi:hypothetical protein
MAVDRAGLLLEKAPVEQLGEAAVEILLRHALGQAEAQHDFVDELLVAPHSSKILLASHLFLQQPRPFNKRYKLHCSPFRAGYHYSP